MTPEWIQAYLFLQNRYSVLSSAGQSSTYKGNRYERSLDYLVRNPHLSGDPRWLVRKALLVAGTALRREAHRRVKVVAETDLQNKVEAGTPYTPPVDSELGVYEVFDFLDRLPPGQDRDILMMLASGKTAEQVAQHLRVTIEQARVKISRARARVWNKWLAA